MKYDEAIAWLRGERSMTNIVPRDPFETWQERIATTDTSMTQQAYWIVKAHHEGLLSALVEDREYDPAIIRKED